MRPTRHLRARKATISVVALALVVGVAVAVSMSVAGALPLTATPSITSGPSGTVASSSATFTFTDSASPTTFQCKLDAGSFANCTSPKTYTGLADGPHTFQVTAKATGKDTSAPATKSWTINTTQPTPPPPSITQKPINPTTDTTATFKFTDTQAGVSFQCKLDGGSFANCTSPKTSTGLADGSHTFQVAAKSAGSPLSAPATWTWSVDTTAPAITLSFPTDGAVYNAATWNAGCATAPGHVCGTASDATGVANVQVAIFKWWFPLYWNGTSFNWTGQFFNTAAGTTSWKYPLPVPVPADGYYTVFVRATDTLGNRTPVLKTVVATFRIDASAPPAPSITQKPTDGTTATTAIFKFTDSEPGVGFLCKLDSGSLSSCASPKTYASLTPGSHCFSVAAVDAANNTSAPASYCWTVQAVGTPFTISGQATQALYPGGTSPVDLVFTNPNGAPIQITGLTITVEHATSHAGCDGPTNFSVTQSLTATPTVAAHSTRSLSDLGVPSTAWPQVHMLNLPTTNQDACQNTTYTLDYTGTATGS